MSQQLKIALFGATGMVGSRIAAEAARRGHQVTALARNPARVPADVANLTAAHAICSTPRASAPRCAVMTWWRAPMRRRRTTSRR
jgi:nucleoside-diphosphate-sugar epimerase